MRFGWFHKSPLLRRTGLVAFLAGGLAVAALPALAQESPPVPLPTPLTTPKPPAFQQPQPPSVPVIGDQPSPPPGYEAVPPGSVPAANMPAAGVGLAMPKPQRQLIRPETEARPIVV